jgi:hypothetical protein
MEEDLRLLANRVSHLKVEEERARKKIGETRRKASEIKELKARNEALAREKEEKRQREEEERRALAAALLQEQHQRLSTIKRKRRMVQDEKKKDVESLKKQHDEYDGDEMIFSFSRSKI